MKYVSKTIQVVLFTLSLFCISIVRGQEKSTNFETSVAYKFPKNNEKNPCISSQEYSILEEEVVENIKKLGVNTLFNKFKIIIVSPIRMKGIMELISLFGPTHLTKWKTTK